MKASKESMLLYVVTDRTWLGADTLEVQVEKILQAGATFLQLREKDLDFDSFVSEGKKLKTLAERHHIPFVINDNIEVALAVDADGVHVGQEDLDAKACRRLLGENKILGVSAQTVEQALLAEAEGADYIGVGAVFSTATKADADTVSLETLKAICTAVSIPVVAIGGIDDQTVLQLKDSGADGIAVVSAIFAAPDITKATQNLYALVKETLK